MASKIVLRAKPRTLIGKKVRRLRLEGRMPAIVYGTNRVPTALDLEIKEFLGVAHQAGTTQLISVEIDGESSPRAVLIRDVQQHITRLTPMHADLIEVDLTQKIQAVVPILITGMPKLAETGAAILMQPFNELTVEALPADLPASIDIDASVLEDFDMSVKVSDLVLEGDVEIIEDLETVLVNLAHPRIEAEPEVELEEGEEGELDAEGDELDADADEAPSEDY